MRIKDRSTVYWYSISICMGSFVFGYEVTSIGNLGTLIANANFLAPQQASTTLLLISSVLALAAIFGASAYKCITSTFGDLTTFRYFDYLTIVASVIQMLNLSVGTQVFARILLGLVVGMNTILIPVYLTSCLPGSMGGPAGTLNQLFITIGIFFGYFIGYLVVGQQQSQVAWRIIVGLPIIPSLIRLHTTANVFPYQTVERMIRQHKDAQLQHYINTIFEQVTLEQFKQMKKLPDEDIIAQKATFFDPKGESYRRRLFMAGGIVFFNQLSGGSLLFNYGGVLFGRLVGNDPSDVLEVFVYWTLLQVIVTYLSGQLLQKYGRRAFMMEGQRVIIVSLLLFSFIQFFVPQLYIFSIILAFIQMIGFSLSFGPCSFLIGTQIMHDITYPSMLLWIFIFLLGLMTGPFISAIGAGPLAFIYCIISIIGFLYIAGYLVQTQGRSRQDVYKQFRQQCFPFTFSNFRISKRSSSKEKEIQIPLVDIKHQKGGDSF